MSIPRYQAVAARKAAAALMLKRRDLKSLWVNVRTAVDFD